MTRSTGRRLLGFVLGAMFCGQLACSPDRRTVALDNSNSGQTVALSAGDELDITLGSIGNQGEPSVSSTAIRYQASSLVVPATPAGPTILYKFTAVSKGQATVTIPFILPTNPPPFTLDVNVE